MIRIETVENLSISNNETEARDLSVPCYVIEHERGRLLWDGGLPSATADTEGWHGEVTLLRLDNTFAEQLAGIDLNTSLPGSRN